MLSASCNPLDELGDFRCSQCSTSAQWALRSPPKARLNSVTAVAACDECGGSVFLKRIVSGAPAEEAERAAREFAIACEGHAYFQRSTNLAVAAPLHQVGPLLVFEYVAGVSPLSVLRGAPVTEATNLMHRLGQWFAKFHEIHVVDDRVDDIDQKFASISKRFASKPPHSSIAKEALGYLSKRVDTFPRRVTRHSRLHGDAKPDNFIVQSTRVVGIDIDGTFLNVPEHDLAQFLSQHLLSASSWFGGVDENRLQSLEVAFLAGYQESGAINEGMLQWLKVYFLLSFWLSWRSPSSFHRLRWDPLFARRLKSCLVNRI